MSIDVLPEMRRLIRLAAAMHDSSMRDYVVGAIEERLKQDLTTKDRDVLAMTAEADPILAQLWVG